MPSFVVKLENGRHHLLGNFPRTKYIMTNCQVAVFTIILLMQLGIHRIDILLRMVVNWTQIRNHELVCCNN